MLRIDTRKILPFIGIAMFIAAVWVLNNEIQHFQWADIKAHVTSLPAYCVFGAVLLTIMLFINFTGYDYVSSRFVGLNIPYRIIALASFLGYAFSQNITPSLVTGGSVRFRVYSNHDITAMQVTQIVAFSAVSLWTGFMLVGSVIVIFLPYAVPGEIPVHPAVFKLAGIVCLSILIYYIRASARGKVIRFRDRTFSLPSLKQVAGQLSVSSLDWILSAGILYLLLPADSGISYPLVLGMYLLAFSSGIISQVPGGLGVFETIMILLMGSYLETDVILGSLLVFRALYYLLPLVTGAIVLVVYEALQRKWL